MVIFDNFLIHSAYPKSRPVGIIVFAHIVRPSPLFKSRKTKQQKANVRYWHDYGSGEWIIDDTCLVTSVTELPLLRKLSLFSCKYSFVITRLKVGKYIFIGNFKASLHKDWPEYFLPNRGITNKTWKTWRDVEIKQQPVYQVKLPKSIFE